MSELQVVDCEFINRANVYQQVSEYRVVSDGIKHWKHLLGEEGSDIPFALAVISLLSQGYTLELVSEGKLYCYQPENRLAKGAVHINRDKPENDHVWENPDYP